MYPEKYVERFSIVLSSTLTSRGRVCNYKIYTYTLFCLNAEHSTFAYIADGDGSFK